MKSFLRSANIKCSQSPTKKIKRVVLVRYCPCIESIGWVITQAKCLRCRFSKCIVENLDHFIKIGRIANLRLKAYKNNFTFTIYLCSEVAKHAEYFHMHVVRRLTFRKRIGLCPAN